MVNIDYQKRRKGNRRRSPPRLPLQALHHTQPGRHVGMMEISSRQTTAQKKFYHLKALKVTQKRKTRRRLQQEEYDVEKGKEVMYVERLVPGIYGVTAALPQAKSLQ